MQDTAPSRSFSLVERDKTPCRIMTGASADQNGEFKFKFLAVVAVTIPDELQQWKFHTLSQRGI
jgi:hypothetical protein